MRKFPFVLFLIVTIIIVNGAPAPESKIQVVATTAWTAAFAEAAGAGDVRLLAPYEMQHPSEYELRPSDIAIITGAQFVIYAGYEGMVRKIKEAIGPDSPQLIQINTTYDLKTIGESIMQIAERLGTQAKALSSIREIEDFVSEWRQELEQQGLAGSPVIVHAFQVPLLKELGAKIAGVFGPAPLEARQIKELSDTAAVLIVDNWHNEVGKPLQESLGGVPVARFINFPGSAGTRSLLDVLAKNRETLNWEIR